MFEYFIAFFVVFLPELVAVWIKVVALEVAHGVYMKWCFCVARKCLSL